MRILILFFIVLGSVCHAELRTWTAVNGKEVEAEFVSNEEGIVKLKLKSGKIFEVPANKLSKEDNAFISSLAGTDEINDNELTMDQVLKIENQPHQPIIDIPQLITAKLKVGMWESERTIDVHESSLQKAKIIQSDECEILKLVLLFSKKGLPSFVMEKFIFFGLQSSYAPKRTLNPPLANIDTWA